MNIEKESFGETKDGEKTHLFRLSNDNGMVVSITNYGGIIISLLVHDRYGNLGDVVLGYDDLSGYLNDNAYMGAIVGRYANRIKNAHFVIDGENYFFNKNEKEHTLHGGFEGFNRKVWEFETGVYDGSVELILKYTSPDGEEGFPGELKCQVKFTLFDDNRLRIHYKCSTDKATHVNLTHHDYFNLCDSGVSTILDHELSINADCFTENNAENIPTGNLISVDQLPMDWRQVKRIGDRLMEITPEKGFDHNYVLNQEEQHPSAVLRDPLSGRIMEIWTNQPGIQLYTAAYLKNDCNGKNDRRYGPSHGICLEGQHFPDSPNNPNFPSTLLRPDEIYTQFYEMRFYTDSQVNIND